VTPRVDLIGKHHSITTPTNPSEPLKQERKRRGLAATSSQPPRIRNRVAFGALGWDHRHAGTLQAYSISSISSSSR